MTISGTLLVQLEHGTAVLVPGDEDHRVPSLVLRACEKRRDVPLRKLSPSEMLPSCMSSIIFGVTNVNAALRSGAEPNGTS